MFIRVRLLNGLPEPLWYSVPTNCNYGPLSGLIVQVPVRNRIIPALVIDEHTTKPHNLAFELKDIHGLEPLPADEHYLNFLKKLSEYYQIDALHFIKRIHHFLINKKENTLTIEGPYCARPELVEGHPRALEENPSTSSGRAQKNKTNNYNDVCYSTVTLTDEQQKVCDFIAPTIGKNTYLPTVLHG